MEVSVIGNSQVQIESRISVNHTQLAFCNLPRNSGVVVPRNSVSLPQSKKRNLKNSGSLIAVKASQNATAVVEGVKIASERLSSSARRSLNNNGVRLYVGLPLDVVSECNSVNHVRAIAAGLKALKLMGVEGVDLPIWWGRVEKDARGECNWSGYHEIVGLVEEMGLKLQVSFCFHGSQDAKIPLPDWVCEFGKTNPDIFFKDQSGHHYKDCLSLAVDNLPVLNGDTPVQVYRDFCDSFKSSFSSYMGSTITGVVMGLGPNGELSYPSQHHKPTSKGFAGVGEFQCYDKYMLYHLKQHAESTGNPLWGLGGPHDVPAYDQPPTINNFFKDQGGSWETPYGEFFLSWYSSLLISHGDRLLSMASLVFKDTPVMISGKMPLMPLWYKTRCHPSELTAGFYNTAKRDGYEAVAEMFARNSTRMVLSGMDLADKFQPQGSSPQSLISQIMGTSRKHSVAVSGLNSAVSGACDGIDQIKKNLSAENGSVDMFIYQRMGAEFFSPKHFPLFTEFVRNLRQPDLPSLDLLPEQENGSLLAGSNKEKELYVQAA